MYSKWILLKLFVMVQIASITATDDNEYGQRHPSLKNREDLYSLYFSIPLSNEIERFEDYVLIHNISNTYYDGKVMEIDSFGWLNGNRQTIYHKLPYLIANPSLRTPHISKEWCGSRDFFKIGFRIYQTTHEVGLPSQIKCASCHPIIEGLNNIYYLYPERDFTQRFTKLSIDSRIVQNDRGHCSSSDCEQNPRVANFQELLKNNDIHFGEITRWSGEHTTTEHDREIMGNPNGELAIHSRQQNGYSTMCGMELNEKVVSSNIFVNTDVVGPGEGNDIFAYKNYESIVSTVGSVKDVSLGLEMFISWDNWGCCSACCCPATICGHDFQTLSDCDNVFSSRSRTGHLSIKSLNENDQNTVNSQYFMELRKLLSVPPYTYKGIPVFSSLLIRKDFEKAVRDIKEKMIPLFLSANKNTTYKFSSGMFVESESCKSHIQKTDCLEWSRCHNISLAEVETETSEIIADTCQQVQFVDVLVGMDNMKVTVGEHQNLRIRMDSEVHDMKTTKAKWRVNLRKPKKYDKSRPCLLQDVVQRVDEILILNFASWDLKIDLILDTKKVRITFVNSIAHENAKVVHYTIFYWAIAIIVFFLLLISAVIFMHREKTRRLERAIKSVTDKAS